MKLSKSQKTYSAVLGLGVCALLYDRCFNSPAITPRPGAANAIAIDHHEAFVHAIGSDSIAARSDISSRLKQLQTDLIGFPSVRDAFVPSSSWIATEVSKQAGPSDRALNFVRAHRVRAILDMQGHGEAIIDNSLIKVGQSIDGFMLSSVSHLNATFVDGDARAVLSLDTESSLEAATKDQ